MGVPRADIEFPRIFGLRAHAHRRLKRLRCVSESQGSCPTFIVQIFARDWQIPPNPRRTGPGDSPVYPQPFILNPSVYALFPYAPRRTQAGAL